MSFEPLRHDHPFPKVAGSEIDRPFRAGRLAPRRHTGRLAVNEALGFDFGFFGALIIRLHPAGFADQQPTLSF